MRYRLRALLLVLALGLALLAWFAQPQTTSSRIRSPQDAYREAEQRYRSAETECRAAEKQYREATKSNEDAAPMFRFTIRRTYP